jgi:hypothetical protein
MRLILILILITNTAFAQNSTTLTKGDTAPFSGVLLTKDRAEKAVKAEKANIVLKDLRISQEELTEYHRQDARIQRRKLSEAKFSGFMSNTLYFVVGVLVTGFAFKVNQKIGEI